MTVPKAYEIDAFEVAHGFVITRFELLHNTGLEELLRNCATILADALTFLRIRILFHRAHVERTKLPSFKVHL